MSEGDRRVRRTQQALQRAFIELLLEKGLEGVSVSEITARADVGRSTFYAHYADKEDLLQGSLEGLRHDLEAQVATSAREVEGEHPVLAFFRAMLEHAGDNRALFPAIMSSRSSHFFLELVHDMWADFVRASWSGADELAVQGLTGAFGSVVGWWLNQAAELAPLEVYERFRAHFEPVLTRPVGSESSSPRRKAPRRSLERR